MKFCQLNARKVANVKKRGHVCDGAGLYLQVSKSGSQSWVFRFDFGGRRREMGLGSARIVSLKQARQLAREAREHLLRGDDPIQLRNAKRDKVRAEVSSRLSFREALDGCLAARSSEWRSDKHRKQWRASVEQHALPLLGNLAVDTIDVPHILSVLEPIWHTKAETANRVRSRIERVLSWATARNYRRGENPARWRGGLEYLLPATGKIKGNVQHLAALPFVEIPAFMADLRKRDTVVARAVELLVLTAARSGDVRGACWDEIDGNIWMIPGHRHKSGREFRVPLSKHAVVVLSEPKPGALVFPGQHGRQLTDKMLLLLVKEMRPGITVHGMRSSFRDWAGARTNYPRDVIEMALAHKVKGATESAYWRDDILEKRRRLLEEWARFCSSPPSAYGQVTAFR